MSQNPRNQQSEGQGSYTHANDHQDRNRYEGFEGMNYEQRRQPYRPHQTGNNDRNNMNDRDRAEERGDEI